MTIAEMIKKTRQDNNMTQEEYANKFGVTRQTVSSWENEKSMPDLQLLITICNTYNFSLDSLLNEDQICKQNRYDTKNFSYFKKNITDFLYYRMCLCSCLGDLENKCSEKRGRLCF